MSTTRRPAFDSRALCAGLLIISTFGAGLVAQMLFAPAQFATWPMSKLLLLAFAMASPPVAFSCLAVYARLPATDQPKYRERRAIVIASLSCSVGQVAAWLVGTLTGASLRQVIAWYLLATMVFAGESLWRMLRQPRLAA